MQKKQVLVFSLILTGMLVICGCGQTAQKPGPDVNPETGVQQTTDAEKRTMASRFSTMAPMERARPKPNHRSTLLEVMKDRQDT